jgi:hypothetical protein
MERGHLARVFSLFRIKPQKIREDESGRANPGGRISDEPRCASRPRITFVSLNQEQNPPSLTPKQTTPYIKTLKIKNLNFTKK